VPDNPHKQRGHTKSVALRGPVQAVAELPRALSSQRVVRRRRTQLLGRGAEVLARVGRARLVGQLSLVHLQWSQLAARDPPPHRISSLILSMQESVEYRLDEFFHHGCRIDQVAWYQRSLIGSKETRADSALFAANARSPSLRASASGPSVLGLRRPFPCGAAGVSPDA
jgi:hypothetical protein